MPLSRQQPMPHPRLPQHMPKHRLWPLPLQMQKVPLLRHKLPRPMPLQQPQPLMLR